METEIHDEFYIEEENSCCLFRKFALKLFKLFNFNQKLLNDCQLCRSISMREWVKRVSYLIFELILLLKI